MAEKMETKRLQQFFNEILEPFNDGINVSSAEAFAVHSNQVVIFGAGVVVRSSIHGVLPKIVIAVAPEQRRKGIATRLHQDLLRQIHIEHSVGVDGQCDSENMAAIGWIQRLGYHSYLDCHLVSCELAEKDEVSNENIYSVSEFLSGGMDLTALRRFLVDRYIETHDWNPVTLPKGDPQWEKLIFARADLDLSEVWVSGRKILGVSIALSSEVPTLDILWSFASGALSIPEQSDVLSELFAVQFQKARDLGFQRASLEIDSTDLALSGVLGKLPVIEERVWKRWRLKRPVG